MYDTIHILAKSLQEVVFGFRSFSSAVLERWYENLAPKYAHLLTIGRELSLKGVHTNS